MAWKLRKEMLTRSLPWTTVTSFPSTLSPLTKPSTSRSFGIAWSAKGDEADMGGMEKRGSVVSCCEVIALLTGLSLGIGRVRKGGDFLTNVGECCKLGSTKSMTWRRSVYRPPVVKTMDVPLRCDAVGPVESRRRASSLWGAQEAIPNITGDVSASVRIFCQPQKH
ncbi:hypothetical protein EYF80_027362 [Liparis tanakae]|uniref:Uncharacterized protein n=1 Tax=Liparis tanakae TaxID=230148 RepID=A0A4Z2HC32_9TELE|nr:hypothetical protein EYF80_027362 [Liparis tanakae]